MIPVKQEKTSQVMLLNVVDVCSLQIHICIYIHIISFPLYIFISSVYSTNISPNGPCRSIARCSLNPSSAPWTSSRDGCRGLDPMAQPGFSRFQPWKKPPTQRSQKIPRYIYVYIHIIYIYDKDRHLSNWWHQLMITSKSLEKYIESTVRQIE
jgi:hypothetical protein